VGETLSNGIYSPDVLLPGGWARNVSIYWDETGLISDIELGFSDSRLRSAQGPLVPGMINLHSHAFQRDLVGRTQLFTSAGDDFWSWRETMYARIQSLNSTELESIATQLYKDLIRSGYTSVCEFHYVHAGSSGEPCIDSQEMSLALLRAAKSSGIGLTLLPVFYQYGGFNNTAPDRHQRRFVLSVEQYCELMEKMFEAVNDDSNICIGYAPHSLRAVDYLGLQLILDHRANHAPSSPVHIHVAEQIQEVEECLRSNGQRPIEWLFGNVCVDQNWCLVHSTHADRKELALLADSGATVGLCPTTEADLGDGTFPLREYLDGGGIYGIGSDSNVCVSPFEELRLLEYGQRLANRTRNVDATESDLGAGTRRYLQSLTGGRRSSGRHVGVLKKGACADFIVFDTDHVLLRNKTADEQLNTVLFSGEASMLAEVVIRGEHKLDSAG